MTYSYKWLNSEEKLLLRTSEAGEVSFLPAIEDNTDYQAFLKWCEEGNTPEPYVAPEPPAPPTPEEKLAASGLTVEELKSLLGIK